MLKSLLLSALMLTSAAFAQNIELGTKLLSQKEIVSLIGNTLPKPGSFEEKQDFAILLKYQLLRTAKDCEIAAKDVDTSVGVMFGGESKILTDAEAKKMSSFLFKVYLNSGVNIYLAKNTFKRPRPYDANKLVRPCIELEGSYAYPSGHSMIARLYARILSQVYPERAQLFLQRANQYALNRVIGGVHHPSDVAAAHVLADYVAEDIIESEQFMKAMDSL